MGTKFKCSCSWSYKMRVRNPSILGAFTGCLLTTVVYVVFSGALSLTWDAHSSVSVTEDFERREALPPNTPIMSVNAFSKGSSSSTVKRRTSHDRATLQTSKQYLVRKLLLNVIATSENNLEDAWHKVNTSWGQDTEEWQMAVGGTKVGKGEKEHVFLASKCQGFPEEQYLSAKQLFCLLEAIYKSFGVQYQWFFIATEPIYVSVYQLERHLTKLDSDSEVVYMGRPRAKNSYCVGESGVVLSHSALENIIPLLTSCLGEEDSNFSQVGAPKGDFALGSCFTRLHKTCYEADFSRDFLNSYTEVFSLPSAQKWMTHYQNFITVYPVKTNYNMQALYTLDQLREIEYQENKAHIYAENLRNSSLCRLQFVDADLDLKLPSNSTALKRWSVANPNSTYFSDHLEPREWYDGELRQELDMLSRQGLDRLNAVQRSANKFGNYTELKFRRVMYGFFRFLGTQGRELILDVETESRVIKRLFILRPFLPKPILLEDSGSEAINKTIDFVVPLSNVNNRFAEFMKTYEDLCLKVAENCRLNLVVYGAQDLADIKTNITVYKKKYPGAQLNIVAGNGKFSRGRALHTGISTLQKSDLAFTCDVDMTIHRSFLNRCRRNTIQGRRVYYPEVFKYYDMSYVYRFEDEPKHGYDISRKHGHWCTYGYGMLCIYKSDYDDVSGYDTTIEGWGGEDIQLVDDVIKHGYEVLRAPDPGLSHRYHPKVCSKKLSKNQHSQCLSSRNEDIADRRRLADNIYYLENKCNIKKKIWD